MRSLLALVFLLACTLLSAQTGPGGVGNSSTNILWLDANSGVTAPLADVSAWADRSGNNNNASQGTANLRPVLTANTVNGYPAIVFDNSQTHPDDLVIPDNATLEGMNGLTAFCVYQLADGTVEGCPRGFLSKRTAPDDQEAYAWFLYNGGSGTVRGHHLDIDGTSHRLGSTTHIATNTPYVSSFIYHGGTPSNNQDQVVYNGNTAVGNRSEGSTSIPNYNSNLHIGRLYGHTGTGGNVTRFNGWISEVVLYNQSLGTARQLLVNNYLASKYGLMMADLDLYSMDTPANGNYDHDVAGIGRVIEGNDNLTARGSGIVEIGNATGINNGEFLIWGHDNGDASNWGGSADRPSGTTARMTRVWRASEVDMTNTAADLGAVDVTFHLSGFVPVYAASLQLLIDINNNGTFTDDTPITGATGLGGQRYRFPGVTGISNGTRFTLGINSTALPIELVAFDATNDGPGVRLEWATASETDNAGFAVERSRDMSEWTDVLSVPSSGNSTEQQLYQGMDETPLGGTSYYRLRQTDLDGTVFRSDAVSVTRSAGPGLLLVPNPASSVVDIHGAENSRYELFDATGSVVASGPADHGIDVSYLPAGSYIVRVGDHPATSLVVQH